MSKEAERKHSVLDRRLVSGLLIGAKAKEALGGGDIAQDVVKETRVLYRTQNGVMVGFEALQAMIDVCDGARLKAQARQN